MAHSTASLNDIAKHLRISPMTVSRAVNGSGSVSAATQARVQAAMVELGYRKDRFASINSRKRSTPQRIRHVIVDRVAEPATGPSGFTFYSTIALAVISALEALDVQVTLTDLTRERDQRLATISSADAIIYCSPVSPVIEQAVRELNRDLQCVTICHLLDGTPAVNPDDEYGGRLAAEYFLRAGHRHVALYGTEDQLSQAVRADSFCRHLRRGCPDIRIDRIMYPLDADGVTVADAVMHGALDGYFLRPERTTSPTAIFALGGYATFILYRNLRRRQLDIPRQIGVLGFDALPFYDHLDTPLSRIGFDIGALGRQAVEVLAKVGGSTGDKLPAVRIAVPCDLIDRGSVLPVMEMSDAALSV